MEEMGIIQVVPDFPGGNDGAMKYIKAAVYDQVGAKKMFAGNFINIPGNPSRVAWLYRPSPGTLRTLGIRRL